MFLKKRFFLSRLLLSSVLVGSICVGHLQASHEAPSQKKSSSPSMDVDKPDKKGKKRAHNEVFFGQENRQNQRKLKRRKCEDVPCSSNTSHAETSVTIDQTGFSLLSLPPEVLQYILSFLSSNDRCNTALVSKDLKENIRTIRFRELTVTWKRGPKDPEKLREFNWIMRHILVHLLHWHKLEDGRLEYGISKINPEIAQWFYTCLTDLLKDLTFTVENEKTITPLISLLEKVGQRLRNDPAVATPKKSSALKVSIQKWLTQGQKSSQNKPEQEIYKILNYVVEENRDKIRKATKALRFEAEKIPPEHQSFLLRYAKTRGKLLHAYHYVLELLPQHLKDDYYHPIRRQTHIFLWDNRIWGVGRRVFGHQIAGFTRVWMEKNPETATFNDYKTISELYACSENYTLSGDFLEEGIRKYPETRTIADYRKAVAIFEKAGQDQKVASLSKEMLDTYVESTFGDYKDAAIAHAKIRENSTAAEIMLQAIRKYPIHANPDYYRFIFGHYYDAEDFEKAAQILEEFWSKYAEKSRSAEDYIRAHNIYGQLGQWNKAAEAIRLCLQKYPEKVQLNDYRGALNTHCMAEDFEQAGNILAEFWFRCPQELHMAEDYILAYEIHAKQGQWKKSAEERELYLQQYPDQATPEAYRATSQAYFKAENLPKAKEFIEKALSYPSIQPDFEVYKAAFEIYWELKDFDNMVKYIERALESFPKYQASQDWKQTFQAVWETKNFEGFFEWFKESFKARS